jgi:hypothetical protein
MELPTPPRLYPSVDSPATTISCRKGCVRVWLGASADRQNGRRTHPRIKRWECAAMHGQTDIVCHGAPSLAQGPHEWLPNRSKSPIVDAK